MNPRHHTQSSARIVNQARQMANARQADKTPLYPDEQELRRIEQAAAHAEKALAMSMQWAQVAREQMLMQPVPDQHRLYRVHELVEACEAAIVNKKYFPPAKVSTDHANGTHHQV